MEKSNTVEKESLLSKLKRQSRILKKQVYTLFFAYKDPRVPWYARVFIACVVAYAFSPIDFIPDFVPVLGYLDDLILIPLGVSLALKLIPVEVMEDAQKKAELMQTKPTNWMAAGVIIFIWLLLIALVIRYTMKIK
ncbi:DUF1232 domain-containing protein [Thermanaerosceptrum fracticalcis]|uniref:DUF1232 domain-containing protein n=1 Tax=Thermanaerosceptrum fracticalcis TaxID=1712410 RepID=A0A7G6DYQ9_THEFR|nr:YkvA family protein [Thermanaerosceptrum fracticalcis]QNB44963.1 DUF1232 domain-containing protein [Thermanaerosceptrum fracticalcis]